jgi:glycine/D-amino acid oxidase-like deaminating enzyme
MSFNPMNDNISFWASCTPNYRPLPALIKNITADLAIIGGGFTGISTAYYFKHRYPEKRVVLLEAKSLANGASGRSGGQMLNWIYGTPRNDEILQQVYQVTRAAMDGIEAIIREHQLPVSYRRDGVIRVLTSTRNAEQAHADVEHLQKLNIPIQYLNKQSLSQHIEIQGARGASFDPSEGQINGAQFIREMRPVLASLGVEIYEQTPVLSVREGKTITLTTPNVEVRASAIVLATNAYTPRLGYFRSSIIPVHSHVFATAPLSADQLKEIGWHKGAGFDDDHTRLSYLSLTREGHIVFGGSASGYDYLYNNNVSFPPEKINVDEMRRTFSDLLPATIKTVITHRWSGPVALNSSGVSGSFGVRGENRNIFYAVGYNGHGITLSNLAGRVLTDIYSGDDQEWRSLPFYQPRALLPVPPEPFRWIGAQLYIKALARKRQSHIVIG